MSLAYLLSILLLYSCFYTLHIPYSFYNLLFYVFGISPIHTFTVFCFYSLHIPYSFYNLFLFISYHYFSDYVNFYHIFHISLRSAEFILYYHIIYCHRFSHIIPCAFIYYTFHIPFSFIYNLVLSYTLHLCFHSNYRIDIHDRFERESRLVCH